MPRGDRILRVLHCSVCDSGFESLGSPGRTKFCPTCRLERRRQKNIDYMRSRSPEVHRRSRAKSGNGFSNHGVTREEYRSLYLMQGGRCAACAAPKPMAWVRGNLELDHCHTTNEVRGLVCGDCNSAAGRVGDDPDRLRAIAEYIEHSRTGLFRRVA